MKFWQSLAFVEMEQMVELAQFCEQLGFHGVSYGDHLVTSKQQIDEYLYRDSGNVSRRRGLPEYALGFPCRLLGRESRDGLRPGRRPCLFAPGLVKPAGEIDLLRHGRNSGGGERD